MEDPRDVHSEESPNYLVRITGFSTKTTEDALLNFFENTRRSGGGEIKDIKLNQEENFVDILFWSSEDAQRVVQKESLNLDGANLTATLKQMPKELPTDQRRLHVMGVSDKTIVDGLMSFMEVVSGGEVESMLFGSNSNAMVTFKEPPDFHELQKICKATSLDGSFIKIEQVKICDSIEISGFTQNTTDDTILYYFKNKRNEGGEVKTFEYISEITDKTIILSFEDPKVVDKVIKKDHVIDGAHVTVRRFYPFLGETSLTNPGGRKKERVVKVDPQTMLFIEEFFSQEFEQLLEQTHVKYTWKQDQGEMVLTCNEEEKMDKKTWENSYEAVVSYVNQIVTEKITVSQEIWELMSDETKEKCNESEHQIHILHIFDFKKKELSVVLRGKKTDVCVLAKRLNDLSLKIEKQMIFEKNKITKEIELSEAQIGLMRFCGFVEDLKGRFKDLEVTLKKKSEQQVIQLRGPQAEVNESHIAVWQLLSKMKESEIELPKSVVGILSSEAGKVIISTQLKNNSIGAVASFDSDNQLLVTAVDRNDMNKAVHLIKDLTVKESIPLNADQKQLISSKKWKEFKLSILQSMILQITEEPASSTLWIAGIKEEVYKAKEKVEVFFDENTKIDTERVSQRKTLTLDGTQLTMTLKEIPKEIPKDPNKLYVTGISDKTTKDGLMSFMEAASGREVESMLYGSYSNAMVTFMEPPDLEKVQKKSSTRTLDGSHLKIEQVNICDCIEVSGLAPNTNTDTILYYFENPKKRGGDVKRVELDSKKARAVVFFENPSVVSNVTKVYHVLNDVELTVVPYYPFLGETSTNPGGGKKEKVIKVDPDAIVFIETFFLKEFNQLFEKTCLNYKWEEGSREIVLGCVDPKMVKEHWENSCEAVASYVNQIVTEKITVSQEAWKDMCDKAKDKYDSFKDRVEISRKEKELSFTLRGMKSDVCVLAEQMNDLNSEIEKKIAYERNKISKKISLTEAQIELFSFSAFVEDLNGRFKDLEVTMKKKELAIHFRGPDPVVREGNIAVWQTLSKVKESEVELPKSITSIVGSDAGKVFMTMKFKKNNIDAVVSFDANSETQLMVTAVDRRDMKKAVELIKDLTSEQSIPLDEDQKQIIQSEKWKKLLISIQSMLLQITEEPASSTLWIAGIKEEVEKAKEKVELYFKENIILDKVIETENGRVKFVFEYKADDIKNIEVSLKTQSVKVKKYYEDDEEGGVVVSGTREGIEKAVPKVEKLINDVKHRTVDLDKPGMKKVFSEKKGFTLLSIVGNENHCIIERCTPSSGIKTSLRFLLAPEDNMWLKVFAASNKDLNKAENDIKELMKDHSKTKEIMHSAVGKLSHDQRELVLQIEAKHDTKIQIDKKINRIVVRGAAEDVSNTTSAIYDILNKKSEEEHARRYAELLSKNIQWYYVDGDDLEPYDSETNAKIEQAFNDKKPSVVVLLTEDSEKNPTRYRIDFSTNIETNLDTGETTRVERRDREAGSSLPAHWDPQPLGSDGRELDVHLVVLDPAKHKKEYDNIKKAIEKTTPINIIKIERVQNPSLYKAYLVKKQKMDDKNGSNEKKLFYGTAQVTCQLINHQAFNRSFCGKKATCYGKGVYFARDARYSMSSTYSPPDGTGKRYMYMASVLAGEYTVGQNYMLAPPPKNPNIPMVTFDTLVDNMANPSIYVVFYDVQCYPDYLITFQ